ncbi:putative tyrosine-protein kinase [Apostichopus japonicus]|uniref:Putative tyrosine-protein kinase n=1 Tax=Stichopus japonicus TaxID=307972 RepID=A0A2G8KE87_STIJA|nr:putative tyrosine-protein kinase [Apostichopus japonicus]
MSTRLLWCNCREECHCDSDACDRVTGECVGCCKHQWIDLQRDVKKPYFLYITGIINVTGSKTNPGTQWSVTCWVGELQQTSPGYTVFLSQSMDLSSTSLGATSILTEASNRTGFIQRGSIFKTDAQAGDTFYCVIPHSTGFAWLNTTMSHYDLPMIRESPEIVDMSQTSVTIKWRAWDEQTDVGDPPVVGYILYYRKDATDSWSYVTVIESTQLLQYTQTNLEEDTIYAFSVSAVREGDMGEGPMGPPMTVKTLCEVPITPTAVMVTITDLNQLNVTWQVDDNDIMCSTGITAYTIYYKVDGSSDDPQRITTVSGSIMYTIIEGLEPGESYTFMVSLTTDQASPLSEASTAGRQRNDKQHYNKHKDPPRAPSQVTTNSKAPLDAHPTRILCWWGRSAHKVIPQLGSVESRSVGAGSHQHYLHRVYRQPSVV